MDHHLLFEESAVERPKGKGHLVQPMRTKSALREGVTP